MPSPPAITRHHPSCLTIPRSRRKCYLSGQLIQRGALRRHRPRRGTRRREGGYQRHPPLTERSLGVARGGRLRHLCPPTHPAPPGRLEERPSRPSHQIAPWHMLAPRSPVQVAVPSGLLDTHKSYSHCLASLSPVSSTLTLPTSPSSPSVSTPLTPPAPVSTALTSPPRSLP